MLTDERAEVTSESAPKLTEKKEEESIISKPSKLTFFVAESVNFPFEGEQKEGLTLEEAIAAYNAIPDDRMKGEKGLGFRLDDGSEDVWDEVAVVDGRLLSDAFERHKDDPRITETAKRLTAAVESGELRPKKVQMPKMETKAKSNVTPIRPRQEARKAKQPQTKESILEALRQHKAQMAEQGKAPVRQKQAAL